MEVWRHGVLEAWQACGRGGIDGEMERWRELGRGRTRATKM
jgi:hypothetical protein